MFSWQCRTDQKLKSLRKSEGCLNGRRMIKEDIDSCQFYIPGERLNEERIFSLLFEIRDKVTTKAEKSKSVIKF